MAEPILRLEGLCKDYGEGLVLSGLSLDVYPGEFLTLLGPSGCGKTTTLRIIAGLERPTAGRVLIDGTDVTGLPPEKRPVNTVFQNYALFPHMTVFQNIAYGLKVLGISKSEQKERVMAALSLVRLAGFERRMPSQLSGGQRQRVAIARAVVLQHRRCFCWMSRWARWISSCDRRCSRSSNACSRSWASPSSTLRTIRRRRSTCPPAS